MDSWGSGGCAVPGIGYHHTLLVPLADAEGCEDEVTQNQLAASGERRGRQHRDAQRGAIVTFTDAPSVPGREGCQQASRSKQAAEPQPALQTPGRRHLADPWIFGQEALRTGVDLGKQRAPHSWKPITGNPWNRGHLRLADSCNFLLLLTIDRQFTSCPGAR